MQRIQDSAVHLVCSEPARSQAAPQLHRACWCSMFTVAQRPSTWAVAAAIAVTTPQQVVTFLFDGQGHALLTAHLLLQVRLHRTHFRLSSRTLIRMTLSVANWKLTCFLHLYRLHCINCIFVRRCWALAEWRHSKLSSNTMCTGPQGAVASTVGSNATSACWYHQRTLPLHLHN